jgi:hypothetical protein
VERPEVGQTWRWNDGHLYLLLRPRDVSEDSNFYHFVALRLDSDEGQFFIPILKGTSTSHHRVL